MDPQFDFGGEIVWRPDQAYLDRANLTHFMDRHGIPDFDSLMARSTEDVPWFTEAVLDFLG